MMEHSPVTQPLKPAGFCCLKPNPNLEVNEHAWTRATTMLYVEHPWGTGFSYASAALASARLMMTERGARLVVSSATQTSDLPLPPPLSTQGWSLFEFLPHVIMRRCIPWVIEGSGSHDASMH